MRVRSWHGERLRPSLWARKAFKPFCPPPVCCQRFPNPRMGLPPTAPRHLPGFTFCLGLKEAPARLTQPVNPFLVSSPKRRLGDPTGQRR